MPDPIIAAQHGGLEPSEGMGNCVVTGMSLQGPLGRAAFSNLLAPIATGLMAEHFS